MPDRPVTAALCGLVVALVLAGCGGSDEPGPTAVDADSADSGEVIDIETIGRSEEEQWSILADRWADTALDEANTVGELLNDRRDLRRLLNLRAPQLREQIVQALEALGPRCRALETEVPPPPASLETPAADLEQACARFDRARVDLVDGLDTGDRDVVERGLSRLARGVNAIATAKAALAPAPR
ncbi:MAG: hypothetical protein ACR2OD_05470 [Gaiellaceae bacterium]